jgi:hypothetical protein
MNRHAWGPAAVTTLAAVVILAAGIAAGMWMGLVAATGDVSLTARTLTAATVLVLTVWDVLFVVRTGRALYRTGGQQ